MISFQNAPPILSRGAGAYVWDADGRRYLDYGMALRAVTLGYGDQRVNAAAAAAMNDGVNLTRATCTELQAAETLINMIPSVEMVKFAKNGSNVTTAALKNCSCLHRSALCLRSNPTAVFLL